MTSQDKPEYSIDRGPFRFETLIEEMQASISERLEREEPDDDQLGSASHIADYAFLALTLTYLKDQGIELDGLFQYARGVADRILIPEDAKRILLEEIDFFEERYR